MNQRNVILRNNILLSGAMKALGLIISFLIVPITLDYLDKEQYGIWMTLSSILMWFSFFDVGLGNGMRNYLAQAIAENDYEKGRSQLTTTIVMLMCIALVLGIVFIGAGFLINLNKVFNTTTLTDEELRLPFLIAIVMTLALFIVKNVGTVYIALQKYGINDLIIILSNAIALIIIYICTLLIPKGDLTTIVIIFTAVPVMGFILASIPLFRQHPELRPRIDCFDWNYGGQILTKGIGFFFIQITSCLIIFGSSNLFITQFVGPEAVTTYNIAYKFFNLLAIAYTIVISPLWNAYTDAYVKCDYEWIRATHKRALGIWVLTVIGGIIMLTMASLFYRIWVGNSISVPFSVSACVFVYICLYNLNNCATMLINGLNKIRIQIITSVAITSLYIAAVSLIGRQGGIEGVVSCMAVSYAIMAAIHLYQCRLLIIQKAKGVWNQ